MQKNLDNIDSIIKKNFPNDINFKRIKKEILLIKQLNQDYFKISLQNSTLGLKIIVDITKNCLMQTCPTEIVRIESAIFEILLEAKFPFIFPKIFCRSTAYMASRDGRDLLSDILKKIWAPSILLHEIIVLIPNFMKDILKNSDDRASLQKLGVYHLGHTYNLEDFLVLDSVDVFPGTEVLNNNKTVVRYITLSQAHLLSFEVLDKKKNLVKLITWASLQSLMNIKRKKDEESTLILTWKDNQKKEGTIQIFNLEDSSKFIELVIKNMKQFGVKVNKNKMVDKDLSEEDVTLKGYEQFNIEEVLETIAVYESRLTVELTIDIVNTLMMLYQKCVEYYSALNDPTFETFVERLHVLLSREDVQILLRSKEEVTKKKTSSDQGAKKVFVPEDDEEEEKKENEVRRPPQQIQQEPILKQKIEQVSSNQAMLSQQTPEKLKSSLGQTDKASEEKNKTDQLEGAQVEEKKLIHQKSEEKAPSPEIIKPSILSEKAIEQEEVHNGVEKKFEFVEKKLEFAEAELAEPVNRPEEVIENLEKPVERPEKQEEEEVSNEIEVKAEDNKQPEKEPLAEEEKKEEEINQDKIVIENQDNIINEVEEKKAEEVIEEKPSLEANGENLNDNKAEEGQKNEGAENKNDKNEIDDDLEKYLDEKDKEKKEGESE